jgi:hypothetical protein
MRLWVEVVIVIANDETTVMPGLHAGNFEFADK